MGKIPTIENLFFNILIYSHLLFPVIFLSKFPKLKVERTFIIICCYGFLFFLVLALDNWGYIPRTKLYYGLYTVVEYLFFLSIIFSNIKSRKFKIIAFFLSIGFFIFQAIYYFNKRKTLDTIPIGIETILIIIFSFYFFYEQLKESVTPIYDQFFFWIAIGISCLCTFFRPQHQEYPSCFF